MYFIEILYCKEFKRCSDQTIFEYFFTQMKMNIVIFQCETIVKSVKLAICKTLLSNETHVYVMQLWTQIFTKSSRVGLQ